MITIKIEKSRANGKRPPNAPEIPLPVDKIPEPPSQSGMAQTTEQRLKKRE